jgi:hypothetical protein
MSRRSANGRLTLAFLQLSPSISKTSRSSKLQGGRILVPEIEVRTPGGKPDTARQSLVKQAEARSGSAWAGSPCGFESRGRDHHLSSLITGQISTAPKRAWSSSHRTSGRAQASQRRLLQDNSWLKRRPERETAYGKDSNAVSVRPRLSTQGRGCHGQGDLH